MGTSLKRPAVAMAAAALTFMTGPALAPLGDSADDIEMPVPGVGATEAEESDHAGPTVDRDAHSVAPSMPKDICADPTITCGFAQTH